MSLVGAGRFYADPEGSGLGRYRPGLFVGEAAMMNAGPLAGTRRCISPYVFAVVTARSGRLFSALRPLRAVDADPKDRENDVGAEACPRPWVEKKTDAATGACSSADAPQGAGVRKASASTPNVARDLNPAPARRRGHMPRASCGFVFRRSAVSVSILTRTALQNAWSFREQARLARRNSVSTRLIAFPPRAARRVPRRRNQGRA